jgi:hypothetical protein
MLHLRGTPDMLQSGDLNSGKNITPRMTNADMSRGPVRTLRLGVNLQRNIGEKRKAVQGAPEALPLDQIH